MTDSKWQQLAIKIAFGITYNLILTWEEFSIYLLSMLSWKTWREADDKSLSYSLFTWNRGILDLNLRNCLIDKQNYHDELSRKQREKERDFRNLKKMELLLKVSWDALTQTQAMHQRLLLEVGTEHRYLISSVPSSWSKSISRICFCSQ